MIRHSGLFIDKGIGMRGSPRSIHRIRRAWNNLQSSVGHILLFPVLHIRQGRGRSGLVDFGIGVSEFDGDVADHFVFEADGLNAGDGFDDGGFAVGYVADGAYVDGGLAGDLLG
jgi:hypothetical protein